VYYAHYRNPIVRLQAVAVAMDAERAMIADSEGRTKPLSMSQYFRWLKDRDPTLQRRKRRSDTELDADPQPQRRRTGGQATMERYGFYAAANV